MGNNNIVTFGPLFPPKPTATPPTTFTESKIGFEAKGAFKRFETTEKRSHIGVIPQNLAGPQEKTWGKWSKGIGKAACWSVYEVGKARCIDVKEYFDSAASGLKTDILGYNDFQMVSHWLQNKLALSKGQQPLPYPTFAELKMSSRPGLRSLSPFLYYTVDYNRTRWASIPGLQIIPQIGQAVYEVFTDLPAFSSDSWARCLWRGDFDAGQRGNITAVGQEIPKILEGQLTEATKWYYEKMFKIESSYIKNLVAKFASNDTRFAGDFDKDFIKLEKPFHASVFNPGIPLDREALKEKFQAVKADFKKFFGIESSHLASDGEETLNAMLKNLDLELDSSDFRAKEFFEQVRSLKENFIKSLLRQVGSDVKDYGLDSIGHDIARFQTNLLHRVNAFKNRGDTTIIGGTEYTLISAGWRSLINSVEGFKGKDKVWNHLKMGETDAHIAMACKKANEYFEIVKVGIATTKWEDHNKRELAYEKLTNIRFNLDKYLLNTIRS